MIWTFSHASESVPNTFVCFPKPELLTSQPLPQWAIPLQPKQSSTWHKELFKRCYGALIRPAICVSEWDCSRSFCMYYKYPFKLTPWSYTRVLHGSNFVNLFWPCSDPFRKRHPTPFQYSNKKIRNQLQIKSDLLVNDGKSSVIFSQIMHATDRPEPLDLQTLTRLWFSSHDMNCNFLHMKN